MHERYDEIRERGGEVLAVSFTAASKAAPYLARHPLPFPVLFDPERQAYQAFELGRTSWGQILRPRVVWGYLRRMAHGWLPRRGQQGEDVMQLGGDFVLDGRRRLVYAYRSADPADRPAAAALLEAVRTVSEGQES